MTSLSVPFSAGAVIKSVVFEAELSFVAVVLLENGYITKILFRNRELVFDYFRISVSPTTSLLRLQSYDSHFDFT